MIAFTSGYSRCGSLLLMIEPIRPIILDTRATSLMYSHRNFLRLLRRQAVRARATADMCTRLSLQCRCCDMEMSWRHSTDRVDT